MVLELWTFEKLWLYINMGKRSRKCFFMQFYQMNMVRAYNHLILEFNSWKNLFMVLPDSHFFSVPEYLPWQYWMHLLFIYNSVFFIHKKFLIYYCLVTINCIQGGQRFLKSLNSLNCSWILLVLEMFLKNYTFTTLVLDFFSGSWIFIFGKLYTFYIKRLGVLWGVVSGHLQVSVLKKFPFRIHITIITICRYVFLNFLMKSALYSGLLDKFLRLKFLWQLFCAFCPLFLEIFLKNPKNKILRSWKCVFRPCGNFNFKIFSGKRNQCALTW